MDKIGILIIAGLAIINAIQSNKITKLEKQIIVLELKLEKENADNASNKF